jgi:hypothetical protein
MCSAVFSKLESELKSCGTKSTRKLFFYISEISGCDHNRVCADAWEHNSAPLMAPIDSTTPIYPRFVMFVFIFTSLRAHYPFMQLRSHWIATEPCSCVVQTHMSLCGKARARLSARKNTNITNPG